jgi:hypothetical protein
VVVARVLARLEALLNGPILDELRTMADNTAVPVQLA